MICADGTDTSTYAGNISITDDGRVCQQWHEQRPHQHVFDDSDFLQDSSIIDAKNFCRNPSDGGDSWCLTSDPFHRWGYCYGRICGGRYNETYFVNTPI